MEATTQNVTIPNPYRNLPFALETRVFAPLCWNVLFPFLQISTSGLQSIILTEIANHIVFLLSPWKRLYIPQHAIDCRTDQLLSV